jgi:uncharacterized damage-inducible protein DinB
MKSFFMAIVDLLAQIFGVIRIWKQGKLEEVQIKQKEVFVKRAENQQDVAQKDKDEELISKVIEAPTPEDKEVNLDEIRKIIAK